MRTRRSFTLGTPRGLLGSIGLEPPANPRWFMVLPDDLEAAACGCGLNGPQAEVAGAGIVIEGLDVADAAIIIFELSLNEKIGLIGGDKSRSSSLGSSLSNETWKHSPPDSATDT